MVVEKDDLRLDPERGEQHAVAADSRFPLPWAREIEISPPTRLRTSLSKGYGKNDNVRFP